MSKSEQRKHGSRSDQRPPARQSAPDGAYYGGFLLISLFAIALWYLANPETWQWSVPVIAALWALGINIFAIQVYRGAHLSRWKQAMARAPLRFTEYGRAGGKSMDAAHGHAAVRNMILVSVIVSAVVVAALVYWAVHSG